jgi:hypothetical protein
MEQPRIESKEIGSLMIFNRSSHFVYIHKKTEKLTTAVYMITNFIKDNEPLKWKIRENSLDLMSLNISFNTVSLSERRDLMKQYQALSLEILSLSAIAYHSGLISHMNFEILSREFKNLLSIIEKDENRKANEETVVLDPAFFESAATAPKGQNDKMVMPDPDFYKSEIDKGTSVLKDIAAVPQKKAEKVQESKGDRQSIIISLLSKKGALSIQGFADNIKGVSLKTIQRELLSMVSRGVLKKEGERRWSTYSLAK